MEALQTEMENSLLKAEQDATDKIRGLQEQLAVRDADAGKHAEKSDTLAAQLREEADKRQKIENELAASAAKAGELEKARADACAQMEALQTEMENMKYEYENAINSLKVQLDEVTQQRDDIQAALAATTSEIAGRKTVIANIQAQVALHEQQFIDRIVQLEERAKQAEARCALHEQQETGLAQVPSVEAEQELANRSQRIKDLEEAYLRSEESRVSARKEHDDAQRRSEEALAAARKEIEDRRSDEEIFRSSAIQREKELSEKISQLEESVRKQGQATAISPKQTVEEPAKQAADWFLQFGNQTYGPISVAELIRWSAECRVAPDDLVSKDKKNWVKAETLSELKMEWKVKLLDGTVYGPLSLGAIATMISDGAAAAASPVQNIKTGQSVPFLHAVSMAVMTVEESLALLNAENTKLRTLISAQPAPVTAPVVAPPKSVKAQVKVRMAATTGNKGQ